jgi:antitoxin MazE
MNTKLSKWGNSLAIRIPASIIESSVLQQGDSFSITVADSGQIILEPLRPNTEINFAALYAQITLDNHYEEVASGSAVGNEMAVW